MHIHWEKTVQTSCPSEQVYAYLSDFSRHREWSRTLEHMQRIADGDANGIGARYMTHERLEFGPTSGWKRHLNVMKTARTQCEVRDLKPGERIVWHARPVPSLGGRADLTFEFQDLDGGGTLIRQQVTEYYPRPVAFVLRAALNVTEDGIREQLERTLDVLCARLDDLHSGQDHISSAERGQVAGRYRTNTGS